MLVFGCFNAEDIDIKQTHSKHVYYYIRGVGGGYLQKSGLICDSWEMAVGNSTCMLFLADKFSADKKKKRFLFFRFLHHNFFLFEPSCMKHMWNVLNFKEIRLKTTLVKPRFEG